jgi:hypothetical protein
VVDAHGEEAALDPAAPAQPRLHTFDGGPMSDTYEPFTTGDLTAIACLTVSRCIGVDATGSESTFDPQHVRFGNTITVDGHRSINGVTCPSARVCVAVDHDGAEVTFDPASPKPSAVVTPIDAGVSVTAVACRSVSDCVAVGGGSELTFDPATPAAAVPVTIDAGPDRPHQRVTPRPPGHPGDGRSHPGRPTPHAAAQHRGDDDRRSDGAAHPSRSSLSTLSSSS